MPSAIPWCWIRKEEWPEKIITGRNFRRGRTRVTLRHPAFATAYLDRPRAQNLAWPNCTSNFKILYWGELSVKTNYSPPQTPHQIRKNSSLVESSHLDTVYSCLQYTSNVLIRPIPPLRTTKYVALQCPDRSWNFKFNSTAVINGVEKHVKTLHHQACPGFLQYANGHLKHFVPRHLAWQYGTRKINSIIKPELYIQWPGY